MRLKALFTALAIVTMAASATACATTSAGNGEPRAERSNSDREIPSGMY